MALGVPSDQTEAEAGEVGRRRALRAAEQRRGALEGHGGVGGEPEEPHRILRKAGGDAGGVAGPRR